VRAIEYRIINRQELAAIGLTTPGSDGKLAGLPEIAVLKCVDRSGQKLTALGDAVHLRRLLRIGVASDPAGMDLAAPRFPVVIAGWPQAS
jgi:hypothetical protein